MFSQESRGLVSRSSIELSEFIPAAVKNLSRDDLVNLYWQYHQRFKAIKIFPKPHSSVLDLGSGDGGLQFWKEHLAPFRKDLKMTAADLFRGAYFDRYEKSVVLNLDDDEWPFEPGAFGFIMCSHLIEHVADWKLLLAKCTESLVPGGIIYIETPSKHTIDLPKKDFYIQKGFLCQITNFFDDGTHVEVVDLDNVNEYGSSLGLIALEKGFCRSPFLEDSLISFGYTHRDEELCQYGLWSKLLFSSYIVLQKP